MAKKLNIPNVKFINKRFLLLGDYDRLADERKVRRIMKNVAKGNVAIRVAESAVFGDKVLVGPIGVVAFSGLKC